jgi:hypothetical protein
MVTFPMKLEELRELWMLEAAMREWCGRRKCEFLTIRDVANISPHRWYEVFDFVWKYFVFFWSYFADTFAFGCLL